VLDAVLVNSGALRSALTSLPSQLETYSARSETREQKRVRSELIGADTLLSGANPVEFDNVAIDMTVFQSFSAGMNSHPFFSSNMQKWS
jgi:hypothetical protein